MTAIAWLHGYTMDSRVWQPLWEALPEHVHVGIDLPGHGGAAHLPMPGSLADWAAVVAEQVRASGCRTLVGLSFGSCVALQLALDHPDLLDRLVLAAPTLAGVADDPQAKDRYLELYLHHRALGPGPALARLWMAEPPAIFTGLRAHPEAYARVEAVIRDHPFRELQTGAMGALASARHEPGQLRALQVPTAVLVGSRDMPRFVENARTLGELLPNVTVTTLDDAGHLPLLERPTESAGWLRSVLARHVALPAEA